ncbi:hypothetical protein B9Z55_021090 [Caenorhabditis nigoni]|uniref:Lin-15A/B-like domain-containing protein n=1 Tax=Caenorhabditis nigoni TaxID=1611254 RepID=A0A2G5TQF1_9PELO|nr:hypothetical protein B9Z55_021090 [Caenorhabditis nigoni]
MNEAIVKEEVIEETCNFTFKNGEYVEVKQEEPEQKPEYLLEKEIKTETSDDFFEDVKSEAEESYSEIEKVSTYVNKEKCEICQKMMPRNSLKMIKCEGNRLVLSEVFNVELFMGPNPIYVCHSHIQKVIHDIDNNVKLPRNQSDSVMRSFVRRNKHLMKASHSRNYRRICHVCHMSKDRSELVQIFSKGIRMVVMIGCILQGTHSVEQARDYIAYNNRRTCYSHQKESIDKIFEHLGVKNIQEFFKCPRLAMSGLVKIARNIDSNFTVYQFIDAFNTLFSK